MYKLIGIDMDGTLLNDNKIISEENIKAITYAKNHGVRIVLCTGRPIEGIYDYLLQLSLISSSDYAITCSGAMIQRTLSKEFFSKQSLSFHEARYLYDLSKSLGIDVNFYINNKTNSKFVAFNSNFYSKFEAQVNNVKYEKNSIDLLNEDDLIIKGTLVNEQKESFKEYKNFFNLDTSSYDSTNLKGRNVPDFFSNKENFPRTFFEKFSVLKTSDFSLEILNKNANKGNAVQSLCDHLNIPMSQVICIGDSGNDEHMIKYAGLGVAMGNATSSIKEAADYITGSNEENGVAMVINKFI